MTSPHPTMLWEVGNRAEHSHENGITSNKMDATTDVKRKRRHSLILNLLQKIRARRSRRWFWSCILMYICITLALMFSGICMLRNQDVSHVFTSWLLLRCYGFVFLNAFWSLHIQLKGLIGKHGILPATSTLDALAANLDRMNDQSASSAIERAFEQLEDMAQGQPAAQGMITRTERWYHQHAPQALRRFLQIPTLCWFFGSSDHSILWQSRLGIFCSILQVLDILPNILLLSICYFCYMSLKLLTRDFLALQWDALILEAGALAILLCPMQLRVPIVSHTTGGWPPLPILWLLRLLVFRLMFSSGWVKLASGDRAWKVFHLSSFIIC